VSETSQPRGSVTFRALLSLEGVTNIPFALPLHMVGTTAPAESPERVLVGRARCGDQGAFRAIHAQFAPGVRRLLGDLLRNPAGADEATQETFVRAFTRLDTLQDADRLRAWLFGIARHVSREHRRATHRDHPPEPASEDPGNGESPETHVLDREAARTLHAALGQISADRRTVLLLRLDHGLGCQEVAEILGWSVPKVKVELHRARQQLRQLLPPREGGA